MICIGTHQLYCQHSNAFDIKILKGESCTKVLEEFKEKYNVLIAFSPTLLSAHAPVEKWLKAENIQTLFEKICYSFQLEYVSGGDNSFLVRSEAEDIQNSDDIILHIKIEDRKEKLPVVYASVYDASRKYFGFTDEQGDCFIKVPKSKKGEKLTIHSLAHHDQDFIIDTDVPYQMININPDPVKVIPVTINTLKKKISFAKQQGLSIENVLVEKIAASSVFQKDIMRTIQMLPGVSAINDSKSSIRIRGANEEATLLMLDNVPIFKADHFYGIFGAFNSWYVKNITLYKNNLPVEYGGRTSGMVRLESDEKMNKFNLNLDLNLLNSGIMAEVPLGKYVNVKFSGRKTYTNLLNSGLYDLSQRENLESNNKPANAKNLIISKPEFDFYDANIRLMFKKGNHQLDANMFKSADNFIDKYNISFKTKLLTVNEELFKQVSDWKNNAYGLNYVYTGTKFDLTGTLYRSSFGSNYDISSNLIRRENSGFVKDTVTLFNHNTITDKGLKLSYRSKYLHHVMFGMEHIIHDNQLYIENDRNPIFEIDKVGKETSVFAQISVGSKSGLYFEPAVRTTYLHEPGKIYFLPQVYLSYTIGDDLTLKSSAGKQVQFIRLFEHENALGQKQQFFAISNNTSIPVGKGTNYMAGFWKSFGSLTLDVEGYFRQLDGAIIHATQSPGLRPAQPMLGNPVFRLFQGYSQSYGTDISLAFEKAAFFSMFTYTISKAENRFKQIFKNQYFPSSEDSRHQIKWINAITLGKFDLSGSYIAASGRPYLDLSSINNPVDRNNLRVNDYIKNLPAYHRLDIGAYYRFRLAGADARIGISIFNVTNRTNVKYRQFVFQLPPAQGSSGQNPINTILGSDVSQLDRTINVSFNLSIK